MMGKLRNSYQRWRTLRWNSLGNIKRLFPQQKHVIKFAFEVAGRQYYQFDDTFAMPYERALMAIAVYEQCRSHCSTEYLRRHVEAVSAILAKKEIDIFKIYELNEQMKDRLNLTLDVELLYKLASIVYFDGNENPCLYEADYCAKKIEFWRQHRGVSDFFLQKPVSDLMPYLQNCDIDLTAYSAANEELNKIHSERLNRYVCKS